LDFSIEFAGLGGKSPQHGVVEWMKSKIGVEGAENEPARWKKSRIAASRPTPNRQPQPA
jgi:hypothetical protein